MYHICKIIMLYVWHEGRKGQFGEGKESSRMREGSAGEWMKIKYNDLRIRMSQGNTIFCMLAMINL